MVAADRRARSAFVLPKIIEILYIDAGPYLPSIFHGGSMSTKPPRGDTVNTLKKRAALGVTAVAALGMGVIATAPAAQADTICISGGICFTQPNGNIINVNFSAVPTCGTSTPYPGSIGNNYIRNRSTNWNVKIYYDYNGDGNVTESERVVTLAAEGQGQNATTFNPSSRYYYCKN